MKLINADVSLPEELEHAYSPAEAHVLVNQSFDSFEKIEGMAQLRRELMLDLDSEVLALVGSGEWLLIKDQAYYFDNSLVTKKTNEQIRECRALELMRSPPPQPKIERTLFRMVDSYTGERIIRNRFLCRINGGKHHCSTDGFGVLHTKKMTKIEMVAADMNIQLRV